MNESPDAHGHDDDDLRTMQIVFAALMGLLVLTVAVAYVDFGVFTLPVAMGIAVVKALMIMVYFMHLSHESMLVRIFAVSGFVSLGCLFAITFADYIARYPAS